MNEEDQVLRCIEKGNNFLLSGGAGSGKTYSLVKVLTKIFEKDSRSRVACITYTNVAVHEIRSRAKFQNLTVSTIHDFLWSNIRQFQVDLKETLIELIQEEVISTSLKDQLNAEHFKDLNIDYKEWLDLKKGIISHHEIILVAERLFKKSSKLCDILKDRYQYILVDEYQDTLKPVVEIFLVHFKMSSKKNIVGFFGDSMQSIFDGIGDISEYIKSGDVIEIVKEQNRRNPKLIIELANKVRDDGLSQKPSEDSGSPNFNKDGSLKFVYSATNDLQAIKASSIFDKWDFLDTKNTKELYLTHNLIAPKAGFPLLMEIYDKDRIIEFKTKVVSEIKKKNIDIDENMTFGEVIEKVGLQPTGVVKEFIDKNTKLFEEAKKIPFSRFKRIYLDKEQLVGDKAHSDYDEITKTSKKDDLIKHIFNIQNCIFLFESSKHNEFIRKTEFKINSIEDRERLVTAMDTLVNMKDKTIGEVIDFCHANRIWKKDARFEEFITEKGYLYNRVKSVKYEEFCHLYNYLEGFTPFTTQHNIKGAEFRDVLVILDNGRWNNYNFEKLFLGGGTASVLKRTKKIFYVCCTRAKDNLVVFYHDPEAAVIEKAKELFGPDNVIKI